MAKLVKHVFICSLVFIKGIIVCSNVERVTDSGCGRL